MRCRALAGSLSLLLAAACATGCAAPRPSPEAPGELVDPATVAGDFAMRQHITGVHRDREISLDAVVQKQGGTLLVLVLTPYGSRGILIEQRGSDVRVETYIPRELPFSPKLVLLDVQRTFLQGLPDPPLPDGWHSARIGDEIVRERWQSGRLHERRYARRGHRAHGEVIVRYEGGWVPGHAPPTIVLVNEWFGYRLELKTSDFRVL